VTSSQLRFTAFQPPCHPISIYSQLFRFYLPNKVLLPAKNKLAGGLHSFWFPVCFLTFRILLRYFCSSHHEITVTDDDLWLITLDGLLTYIFYGFFNLSAHNAYLMAPFMNALWDCYI